MKKVYMASGWFTPNTDKILSSLESLLTMLPGVDPYFPRIHGVKLSPGEMNDKHLREKVFTENLVHIEQADFLIANLDGSDSYYDTGTVYEVGYAMAAGVPVIGFDLSGKSKEVFKGLVYGFLNWCSSYEELTRLLFSITSVSKNKILFAGSYEESVNTRVAAVISDVCRELSLRWVVNDHNLLHKNVDYIFNGVTCMVAVIDDRHPIVSWMIGQAYRRGIPVVSYTDHDYGVNVMLLESIHTHVKGCDELSNLLRRIDQEGIQKIPTGDTSTIRSM